MKRTTALLALCLLAALLPVAGFGAPSQQSKLSAASRNLQAALAGNPAAPQAEKAPQWKSRAEYDAFQAILKASSPEAKVSAVDAFLQKYPTSDFKSQAMFLKFQAYVQQHDVNQAITAANQTLKANANNGIKITALHYLAYVFPYVYKPGEAAQLSEAQSEAREGLQLLQQVQKPANLSQEAFESQIKSYRADFNRALGFAALQQKDDASAITYLKAAAEDNPNDSYTVSFLGQAYLFMKPADYNSALWYLARADALAKKDNTPNLAGLEKLYNQWYEFRHGSNSGEQALVEQASGGPTPPAGFNVSTPPKHKPTGIPSVDALYAIQDNLSIGGDASQQAWNGYKGQPLAIVGFVEGVSKGNDPGTYVVKTNVLPNDRGQAGVYQLQLITNQADAQYLQLGDPIHFKGTISAYTMSPSFVLTISDAQIDPQSLQMASERAKAKAQEQKAHPAARRRR
ncbi:MAG: tetratricopeptide repeat protein [Terriglobia bacterium]